MPRVDSAQERAALPCHHPPGYPALAATEEWEAVNSPRTERALIEGRPLFSDGNRIVESYEIRSPSEIQIITVVD